MIESLHTDDIGAQLARYEALGGIICFKLFRINETYSEQEAHTMTAQHTLNALQEDNDRHFARLGAPSGADTARYYRLRNRQLEAGEGRTITVQQLLGPYFNAETGKLASPGKPGTSYETGHPENDFVTRGYTDAFLNPPYALGNGQRMTIPELEAYFVAFNQFFLGDFARLTVYSWPVDCSSFFDEGKEWWGSYFWTVYNPEKDWYLGIAVSGTD